MAQHGVYRTSPKYITGTPLGIYNFFQSSVTGTFDGVKVVKDAFYVKLGLGNGKTIIKPVSTIEEVYILQGESINGKINPVVINNGAQDIEFIPISTNETLIVDLQGSAIDVISQESSAGGISTVIKSTNGVPSIVGDFNGSGIAEGMGLGQAIVQPELTSGKLKLKINGQPGTHIKAGGEIKVKRNKF